MYTIRGRPPARERNASLPPAQTAFWSAFRPRRPGVVQIGTRCASRLRRLLRLKSAKWRCTSRRTVLAQCTNGGSSRGPGVHNCLAVSDAAARFGPGGLGQRRLRQVAARPAFISRSPQLYTPHAIHPLKLSRLPRDIPFLPRSPALSPPSSFLLLPCHPTLCSISSTRPFCPPPSFTARITTFATLSEHVFSHRLSVPEERNFFAAQLPERLLRRPR